jgi:tetratricopeptide (TPR) repeat protein
VAQSLINVALYLAQLDKPDEAEVHARRAVAITEAGLGPRHPRNAVLLSNYGEILNRLGRFVAAREMSLRALEIFESEAASDGLILTYPLVVLGLSLLEEGKVAEAIPVLERAVSLREAGQAELALRGEVHFALARAVGAAGDRSRARALAVAAVGEFAGAKGTFDAKTEVERVHAWLAALESASPA